MTYTIFQDGFQARGITRAFSWGFFFPWGMDIDVYDDYDRKIGKIEGKLFTKARAKFKFLDVLGHETAIAFLNTEASDFAIVSPQSEMILADLKGKAYGDLSVWEMNFIQSLPNVDSRLLKIFAAFVADYHSEFLPPPKVENHYYFFNNNRRDY